MVPSASFASFGTLLDIYLPPNGVLIIFSNISDTHRVNLSTLIRGLLFTCQALQNMQRDRNAELHVCFRRSFDANLKPRLSFIVRSVVSVSVFLVALVYVSTKTDIWLDYRDRSRLERCLIERTFIIALRKVAHTKLLTRNSRNGSKVLR